LKEFKDLEYVWKAGNEPRRREKMATAKKKIVGRFATVLRPRALGWIQEKWAPNRRTNRFKVEKSGGMKPRMNRQGGFTKDSQKTEKNSNRAKPAPKVHQASMKDGESNEPYAEYESNQLQPFFSVW
jgi:hypothetical protein